jgi:lysophospholipase L1-like esterase
MKNWFVTLLTVTISVLAFELILRAIVPESQFDRFGSQRVENLEFSYIATHNSLGYRGEEFSPEAPPDTRRVLFIGDSFVYGAGVARSDTVPSLLENKLNSLNGPKFEVLNLGLPDGNTIDYLKTAKAFSNFEADIVLLGYYVNNDHHLWERPLPTLLVWELTRRAASALYYYVSNKCRYDWVYDYDIDPFYQDLACNGKINPWIIRKMDSKFKNEQSNYRYIASKLSERLDVMSNIKSIRNLFGNKAFYIVIFPSIYQSNNTYFDTLRKFGVKFKNDRPVNGKIQSVLKKMLGKNNIKYIDLLPSIKKSFASENRQHFYVIDGHLNAFGNEVAATAIAEVLRHHLVE